VAEAGSLARPLVRMGANFNTEFATDLTETVTAKMKAIGMKVP
jgi:hypothetical protein